MKGYEKWAAAGLAICALMLPLADFETPLKASTLFNATSVKQEIGQLGIGAKVKIKLAGGKRLRGSVEAIEADDFLLKSGRASGPQRIGYEQVAQVKLSKLTYRTSAHLDTMEVRRVVISLGVGKHVMVKTTGGQEYHGNIQAIDQDQFTVLPDFQSAPVQIAYSEVL
jgi:ribosome maturation factor RimP